MCADGREVASRASPLVGESQPHPNARSRRQVRRRQSRSPQRRRQRRGAPRRHAEPSPKLNHPRSLRLTPPGDSVALASVAVAHPSRPVAQSPPQSQPPPPQPRQEASTPSTTPQLNGQRHRHRHRLAALSPTQHTASLRPPRRHLVRAPTRALSAVFHRAPLRND